jgi:hypothetical protein
MLVCIGLKNLMLGYYIKAENLKMPDFKIFILLLIKNRSDG